MVFAADTAPLVATEIDIPCQLNRASLEITRSLAHQLGETGQTTG